MALIIINTITLTYESKSVNLEVEIIEEEKAQNSNLSNVESDIKQIKAYYFTNNSQKDYTLIEIEVNNIQRNLSNDKVEYYYYLSTVKDEKNITQWVKIKEEYESNDKLKFTINSKDISNYEDISKENVLYLYIKEVAIKGGDQSVAVSNAISLKSDVEVETYINNIKKENINSGNNSNNTDNSSNDKDTTMVDGKIPQTGVKTVISFVFIVMIIGGICYFKYNKLKEVK